MSNNGYIGVEGFNLKVGDSRRQGVKAQMFHEAIDGFCKFCSQMKSHATRFSQSKKFTADSSREDAQGQSAMRVDMQPSLTQLNTTVEIKTFLLYLSQLA